MHSNNSAIPRFLLFASIFTAAFWVFANLIDIYRVQLVGVVFEMLWLPMLAGLFVLPVISVYFLLKEKFSFRSFPFYSLIILISTALFLFLMHR